MGVKRSGPPKSLVPAPPASELRDLLGCSYEVFDLVAHPRPGVTNEWRCYKKDTPPVLKVIDGQRNLYFVRPDRGCVHVTVVLGPAACDAALAGRVPAHLHDAIRSAPQYPEGRPIQLELRRLADVAYVEALVAVKLAPAAGGAS